MSFSNKLLSFHEKLVHFLNQHFRIILAILIFLVLTGLLWGGFIYYKSKREKTASLELMKIANSPDIIQELRKIKEKYKGTQAAFQASLILFNYYFQENNLEEIQKLIQELKKDYPKKAKGLILYGEAKIWEIQGKYSKALEIYKKILKIDPFLNFFVYLDIGRVAEKIGQTELAKNYYEKYIKEISNNQKGLAEYKVFQLTTKK